MTSHLSLPIADGKKLEETEEKIVQFLKDHPEIEVIIPVIIGLVITSRFQLRGANALMVNLAVASIARQVFVNLNQSAPALAANSAATAANNTHYPEADNEPYKIVHSVPGRIRLKVPQVAKDTEFRTKLQQLLNEDNHVNSARINRDAASVVIRYDAQGLSDLELGLRLLGIMNQAQGETSLTN